MVVDIASALIVAMLLELRFSVGRLTKRVETIETEQRKARTSEYTPSSI